ncbi:hypothetical protein KHQ81_11460 [Mycoplasmatota bacterium]|nr:hypothetical protein KHQ81_11460 [Mycoplasmatota bacterium]
MDLNIKTILSIVDLINNVKTTYKGLTYKNKPLYNNRPQYRQMKHRYPQNHINRRPPPQNHRFWI